MKGVSQMQRIKTALDTTGLSFAHFAWINHPAEYGVYAEDSGEDLEADDIHAERGTSGTIDFFTRKDDGSIRTAIENALQGVCGYRLNSIQYENDTGYIHYEWVFWIYG